MKTMVTAGVVSFIRSLTITVGVVFSVLLLQLLLFSLFYLDVPDQWQSPFFENLVIFQQQSSVGFFDMMSVLLKQPLLLVENFDASGDNVLWSIQYFPRSTVFFAACVLLSYMLAQLQLSRQLPAPQYSFELKRSGFLLVLSLMLTQLQNIECCGSGPGWLLEVIIRSHAFKGASTGAIDWTQIYGWFFPFSTALQVIFVAGILGLLTKLHLEFAKYRQNVFY